MECGQNLSLPKDIPWRRLAFSPDMFDTNFKDPSLPAKWRSSLAGFYYVVPEEETEDMYPDRRIMYLKVTASITGCNFTSEGLLGDEFLDETYKKLERNNVLDRFQISSLEIATGELSAYYPCSGAIMQVAIFPHYEEDNVSLWDYPYIQDFEPKKREIYETFIRNNEALSGSTEALNIKKGITTAASVEVSNISTGNSVSNSTPRGSTSSSLTGEWGSRVLSNAEVADVTTTDNSKEKRETQSYTTVINQMYQPLLSYHLGTNRALWTISPRPHVVDSEFNLIHVFPQFTTEDGTLIARKLEGIQDVFLVVNMPKNCKGFCFQASLDTGYEVLNDIGLTRWQWLLIVMRRTIMSCGTFDDKGNFTLDKHPSIVQIKTPLVVNEANHILDNVLIHPEDLLNIQKKTELVFKANERSKFVMQQMFNGFSSRAYRPRQFAETESFKMVLKNSLEKSSYKLLDLVKYGYITETELAELKEFKFDTVEDLFIRKDYKGVVIDRVRQRLIDSTIEIGKKITDYQRVNYENTNN